MKSPDEIKKGLECCRKATDTLECPQECPYYKDDCNCGAKPYQDCLAYTQQLEATVSEKEKVIAELSGKIGQLEAERDAAVADLRRGGSCFACKNWRQPEKAAVCFSCRYGRARRFEWRGVPKEVAE